MMTGMMRNIRSWPKASSTISKRKNRSCFRSLRASSMRKRSAQKWRLGRKSLNGSLANVRPKLKVALEHGKQGKEARLGGEREQPEGSVRSRNEGRVSSVVVFGFLVQVSATLAIRRESETVRIRHE